MLSAHIRAFLLRYHDILLFVVCLFAANFFWKLTVSGDEGTNEVFWLGMNISAPFRLLSEHIAQVAFRLTHLFTDTVHFRRPYSVFFDSGFGYAVVWTCTAVKQSFIWLIIMLFARGPQRTCSRGVSARGPQRTCSRGVSARGPQRTCSRGVSARGDRKHKLWFIPMGWLVAYGFNILRIVLIGLLCEHHPNRFPFYHEFLFKHLFYAVLFLLWVWWIERWASPESPNA